VTHTAAGVVLALLAAVALNGSYLMQHAGSPPAVAVDARRPVATLGALLRSPLWALGLAVGLAGWGLDVAALREAPLSLVQAFVAGGLVLVAPMAVLALRIRLTRSDLVALAVLAAALALLGAGARGGGSPAGADGGALAAWLGGSAALAGVAALRRGPAALAVAAGLLYGAADVALKAVTGARDAGGALTSPWLLAALALSGAAFFAFQRALQGDRPVAVIAAMTAATNVCAIAGAFAVFGDPLGTSAGLAAVHAVAFVAVVVAGWRLAPVQASVVAPAPVGPQAGGQGLSTGRQGSLRHSA
jgi:hypothetical protein